MISFSIKRDRKRVVLGLTLDVMLSVSNIRQIIPLYLSDLQGCVFTWCWHARKYFFGRFCGHRLAVLMLLVSTVHCVTWLIFPARSLRY